MTYRILTHLHIVFMPFLMASLLNGAEVEFLVEAGDHPLSEAPYRFEWNGEAELSEDSEICLASGEERLPGQVEVRRDGRTFIWFLATVPAGESREYAVHVDEGCGETRFEWATSGDHSTVLRHGDVPVLEYIHPEFDAENIENTKKPFHHAYSPDGSRHITKGLGGLYPHHRGIYFGYNRINFDGGSADIWHATRGEHSEHRETLTSWSGPVFGGHVVQIAWVDTNGTEFINETRTIRAFKQSNGEYLVDFESTLESLVGDVELGGDNHHAGVQFRASQYVADNNAPSRFLRPAQWAELNPGSENAGIRGLPWNAFQFIVEGDEYTVAYLTHPLNSEIAPENDHEMSERRYGRFGEFIPTTLETDAPLTFRYRFWVTERRDDISREEIEAQHRAYALGSE